MKKLILALALCSLRSFTLAHQVERSSEPKYTYNQNENHSQIYEQDVLLFFQILEEEFGSQVANASKPMSASFDWKQIYLGAGALLNDGNFTIMLWGGMVRAPFMNYGILASILCHEVGHRLGGKPHQIIQGEEHWSSAEGQSDHFAATVCLPKVYQRLLKQHPKYLAQEVEPMASRICQNSLMKPQCIWTATSGIDMIQFLQVYYERDIPFAQPDQTPKEIVTETLHSRYPSYQCRMEIFKAGASCEQGLNCPRLPCWFRPQSEIFR